MLFNNFSARLFSVTVACLFILSCDSLQDRSQEKVKESRVEESPKEKALQELPAFKDGDIIFQTSSSGQSKAIQLATRSKYSHVGIIYMQDGKCYVFEAIQPVKVTPIETFIARGDDRHYVVKRLKDSDKILKKEILSRMKQAGKKYKGKDYDIYFGWSDDRIYCSELVYKVYKEGAGIELGNLQKLREFDLSSNIVKKIMSERYGTNIPYDETVISPASIFDDPVLMTVAEQ